jgi:hypothetical protein
MEVLPPSLSYSASKQALRMNRFVCRPTGADDATPGTTFRINLPSKSLVNLSSFNLCFNLELIGLLNTGDADYVNAKLPFAHKLFSAVRVYVGGQLVSGGLSNHYDLLYTGLVKSSAGEDWCRSRYNDHARELIENSDEITSFSARPGATSKKAYYCISDFLGIFRGNGTGRSIIDTSLWGDISIEITLNSNACIAKNAAGANNIAANPADNARALATARSDVSYKIQDIEGYVECITQTTPLYIKLITMLLDSKEQQIRFPYQNFVTGVVSSGKNARLQVNSGCIDAMVVLPLHSNFNNGRSLIGVADDLSAQRYKFTACDSAGAVITVSNDNFTSTQGSNLQIQIGSDTFPKVPINNYLQVSDITSNSLFSNSLYSQNLLFNGWSGNASSYSRQKFLSENFVWVQSFSDGEGWASKILTGIDTASQNLDVIVNAHTPANGSLFIGALLTSLLVFDTRTGQVSVVQ